MLPDGIDPTEKSWPLAAGSGGNIAVAGVVWLGLAAAWRRWPGLLTGALVTLGSGLMGLVLYFFRDPERVPPSEAGLVVSPADGEVVASVIEQEDEYLGRRARRVSIFLNILDVHVQRSPLAGVVTERRHRPGAFLQAFRPEASEQNEHIAMVVESDHGPVLVKQIAGIMARRCVNTAAVGDRLERGERFGLIRFGSRVDLFLPTEVEMLVRIGDRVEGGVTPVARLSGEVAHE